MFSNSFLFLLSFQFLVHFFLSSCLLFSSYSSSSPSLPLLPFAFPPSLPPASVPVFFSLFFSFLPSPTGFLVFLFRCFCSSVLRLSCFRSFLSSVLCSFSSYFGCSFLFFFFGFLFASAPSLSFLFFCLLFCILGVSSSFPWLFRTMFGVSSFVCVISVYCFLSSLPLSFRIFRLPLPVFFSGSFCFFLCSGPWRYVFPLLFLLPFLRSFHLCFLWSLLLLHLFCLWFSFW